MPLAVSGTDDETRVRSAHGETPGCLVLVVAAEQTGLDLLLTAARRRLPDLRSLEFPKLFTTRRTGPRDAEVVVSRELFRDIEHDGCFLATWAAGGHQFGLPLSVRDALFAGRTVVVAAPAQVVADLQDMCPDLRVVRLMGGLDATRAPLTPQACLRRMMGPRLAQRLEGGHRLQARTHAISCSGGVASTVRTLTDVLARIEHEQQSVYASPRKSHKSRSPLAQASSF